VSLNIKNERTHALVRRLAETTGQSQTSAIEDAVQRRLDEVLESRSRGDEAVAARRAEVARLLDEIRLDLDAEGVRAAEASLYDESGLPR
jgi:antitoxin VapB